MVLVEVVSGGAVALDRARRGDVVGGDAVAEAGEHAGVGDVLERFRLGRQVIEERRPADIGGALIPREPVAGRDLERVPALVAVEHLAVGLAEHVRLDGLLDGVRDLGLVGPDVLEEDVVAVGVGAERLVVQIDVHRPRQRVGDAQRRRREVVHLDVGVDPSLEVPVARQDRNDGQVLGLHDIGDLGRQRPGVADAGRAPIADQVEAKLVEVLIQARALQVLGHHLGARCQRGLDPWLDREPALDGVAGEDPGAEHHRRVRGVGAARDRGDHDMAVIERRLGSVRERDRRSRCVCARPPAGRRCRRGAGLAVVATAVGGGRVGGRKALLQRLVLVVLWSSSFLGQEVLQRQPEGVARLGQRDPVLRALGAGDRRDDVGQVQLDLIRERRLLGVLVVPQPLLLGVRLDQRDLLCRAARELEIAQRLGVDREDRAGRPELRRHVADRRAVGQRQPRQPGAVELDELADDAALPQHLGDGQHQVGGGRALRQLADQLEAEHLRDQHRHRLAEHRRLGLDPADAPAEHAQPVDHRRVRVGPDQRVGVGLRRQDRLDR